MTITSYQVQNILRTYAKQLSRGQRLARNRAAQEQAVQRDEVNISIEARRKQVIEKITSEIVANLGSRLPGLGQGLGGVEEQALSKLSQERGQTLEIVTDTNSGQLMFREVNSETGEVIKELDAEESAGLQDRLYTITQEIIDENMV